MPQVEGKVELDGGREVERWEVGEEDLRGRESFLSLAGSVYRRTPNWCPPFMPEDDVLRDGEF